ncbi:MAG: class I SAM-dependent methyltransferase [Bacteroidales bacterium]|jgi:SAM-dependent methyltransferase
MEKKLHSHLDIWKGKYILRYVYTKWYKQIISDLKKEGKTIELGAGSGNFKEFKPDVISTDIENLPWLDMAFDAHKMPFKDEEIKNIVMIDVLHHLSNPILFFDESYRVLEKGGRILIIEPYISFFSNIVFKIFHPEPVIKNIDYFTKESVENKNPWDSNQAIAIQIFYKDIDKFKERFKNKFKIIKKIKSDCILYPLSGGFEKKQLIPDFLIPLFNIFEVILKPFCFLFAFRCYIVIEKNDCKKDNTMDS